MIPVLVVIYVVMLLSLLTWYGYDWEQEWRAGHAVAWQEILAVLFWPAMLPIVLFLLARENRQRLKRAKAPAKEE